jgi:hypothetical protein
MTTVRKTKENNEMSNYEVYMQTLRQHGPEIAAADYAEHLFWERFFTQNNLPTARQRREARFTADAVWQEAYDLACMTD